MTTRLEDLKPDALVKGLVGREAVRIVSAEMLGDAACKVEFRLDYEFASTLLGKLVAPVFDNIAKSFIDAFARRAEVLYG